VVLFVLLALSVAGVIVLAVLRFSSEQIMHLIMVGVDSPEEAQAMFDLYVMRVLLVAAAIGILGGGLAATWLVRRVLRPIEQLTDATLALASGDLAARVAEPPEAELQRLASAFNRMASSLERVEHLRKGLVEDVAHELRTPLTSLRGYTEALADGVVEPTPEMLRLVQSEIERLARLVEGLDQLARGDHEMRRRAWVEVDLAAMMEGALELVAPELRSRNIRVSVHADPDLPLVMADADAIGQVVSNLVQNAARYTDDGGDIVVRLATDGDLLRCSVENTGPTIPSAELPLIWERMYRTDPSRARSSGGAGIGLAIVRQVIEGHGGSVGATSGNGRTSVWFLMPTPH
jgi:signal transduction histidine kinase